jgi:hypothetical protein
MSRDANKKEIAGEQQLFQALCVARTQFLEKIVKESFILNRDLFVTDLKRRIRPLLNSGGGAGIATKVEDNREWVAIESLSRLRAVVGGRFQNLKDRWMRAGFPLREHRGDKASAFEIDEIGWVDLCQWVAAQGFEIRLTPAATDRLFEVRSLTS